MNSVATDTSLLMASIVAGLVLLYPFRRHQAGVGSSHNVRLAVYRKLLAELERERLLGLFSDDQADYARAEVARRLLVANDNNPPCVYRFSPHQWTIASMVVLFGATFVLYFSIGSRDLPSHESRPIALGMDVTAAVANAEQADRKNPDDGSAWDMRGPTYHQIAGLAGVETAYHNVIRMLGQARHASMVSPKR